MRWNEDQLAKYRSKGAASSKKTRNKMGNVITTVGGETFQSQKEASRWVFLTNQAKNGKIKELRKQYPIAVVIKGEHICTLIVDFHYKDRWGDYHYEDVKGRHAGVQYQLFRLKCKLVRAINDIVVEEI